MAKEFFEHTEFREASLALIDTINDLLVDYESQGFDLTLRQLYYQLVARNIIENTQQSYKRLGKLVSKARRAGLIDWAMMVDRGRPTYGKGPTHSPYSEILALSWQYSLNKWDNQHNHLEVMVEKQALEGVLQPVCTRNQVNFTSNKGYSSDSAMYRMGARLAEKADEGKAVHILYLGDHDPSGLDMDRDIEDRLSMFGGHVVVTVRLALTMQQIEEHQPPPNPAKLSDSRAPWYIHRFGHDSWELDALEPAMMADLLDTAIRALRDDDLWQEAVDLQGEIRETFRKVAYDYRDSHPEYDDIGE